MCNNCSEGEIILLSLETLEDILNLKNEINIKIRRSGGCLVVLLPDNKTYSLRGCRYCLIKTITKEEGKLIEFVVEIDQKDQPKFDIKISESEMEEKHIEFIETKERQEVRCSCCQIF